MVVRRSSMAARIGGHTNFTVNQMKAKKVMPWANSVRLIFISVPAIRLL